MIILVKKFKNIHLKIREKTQSYVLQYQCSTYQLSIIMEMKLFTNKDLLLEIF